MAPHGDDACWAKNWRKPLTQRLKQSKLFGHTTSLAWLACIFYMDVGVTSQSYFLAAVASIAWMTGSQVRHPDVTENGAFLKGNDRCANRKGRSHVVAPRPCERMIYVFLFVVPLLDAAFCRKWKKLTAKSLQQTSSKSKGIFPLRIWGDDGHHTFWIQDMTLWSHHGAAHQSLQQQKWCWNHWATGFNFLVVGWKSRGKVGRDMNGRPCVWWVRIIIVF